MTVFFSVLNTAAINARILILSAKNPAVEYKSRRLFLKHLALSLIEEQTKFRASLPSLPKELKAKLQDYSKSNDDEQPPQKKKKSVPKKRCSVCPPKKDRKTKTRCAKCENHLCLEHATTLCPMCC